MKKLTSIITLITIICVLSGCSQPVYILHQNKTNTLLSPDNIEYVEENTLDHKGWTVTRMELERKKIGVIDQSNLSVYGYLGDSARTALVVAESPGSTKTPYIHFIKKNIEFPNFSDTTINQIEYGGGEKQGFPNVRDKNIIDTFLELLEDESINVNGDLVDAFNQGQVSLKSDQYPLLEYNIPLYPYKGQYYLWIANGNNDDKVLVNIPLELLAVLIGDDISAPSYDLMPHTNYLLN